MGRNERIMDALIPPLAALRARNPDRLFVICTLHEPEMRDRLRAAGFLTCSEPLHAIRAAKALVELGEGGLQPGSADRGPKLEVPAGPIDEATAKALLAPAGIPFPPERLCTDVEAAVAAADELGYPVAMKIVSADITHKSDVGGVRLNLRTPQEVRQAHSEMLTSVADALPTARISGVLVAPMITGGVETVIGAYRDPVFGPVVMLGLGGVLVELFRDVVFRPAPVSLDTARQMIGLLKAAPLLTQGLRGRPPMDTEALAAAVVRVSEIAASNADSLDGIEVNPWLALPQGGYALDALISLKGGAVDHD
jgi:acyl-CoA synthetase (NDP forming)